jgi:hypothetical protein
MIRGWTSGNLYIDEFINDTIYNVKEDYISLIEMGTLSI